jgi:hypothetical protein
VQLAGSICVCEKKKEKYLQYLPHAAKKNNDDYVARAAHGCGSGRYRMGR